MADISWFKANSINFISIVIVLTFAGSVLQGFFRGGSGSAKHLLSMLVEAVVVILSMFVAWKGVQLVSPLLQTWLKGQNLQVPSVEISALKQAYYTALTSIRDFPLLRFGVLFLLGYMIVKQLLNLLIDPLIGPRLVHRDPYRERSHSFISSISGGAIGSVAGFARALILIAVLFIYVTLFPHSMVTPYIESSQMYQKGAKEVISPFTGDFIADKVPVFTRAVEQEFTNILQRKYEVLDAKVPGNIVDEAKEVTASGTTDEEKAKLLYQWVGTRVHYDWDKVKLYEEQRIWKEQTPEDTFNTKEGVCIDYSRLYAQMARAVGLDVKVVTGLGYDGQGSYGPHAWNEVYLKESKIWVPLDSTWVASGGNWFNPPNFDQTHIRDV
ncbi:transglutaminase domain-containing protein [Paenibacillus chondroitinus]|uniref:Transglutaminase domain-containing protein n=1 Tax=Paenibacillus chondroitinus TaxID=59842 RepID=A0ABU6D5W3_9BACL|nr:MULTISPECIES: transglutaminase domain-containing protein [Paenibacillus]MCY9660851.1 transglutaminase domain-containing protein [Paenibacillus anseongense]MEB4792351.1 transglutaminase domain-containing protein [Paenibacillus chondroitinus]